MAEPDREQDDPSTFTEAEIRLIRLWAFSQPSAGRQVSAQAAYFATPAVFGIWGIATGSLVTVGVAFICILLLLVWGFLTTWRDQRDAALMQSICSKLLEKLPGSGRP